MNQHKQIIELLHISAALSIVQRLKSSLHHGVVVKIKRENVRKAPSQCLALRAALCVLMMKRRMFCGTVGSLLYIAGDKSHDRSIQNAGKVLLKDHFVGNVKMRSMSVKR